MPIAEAYPQSTSINENFDPLPAEDRRSEQTNLRSVARAAGIGAVALGTSLGIVQPAHAEQPDPWNIPSLQELHAQDQRQAKASRLQRKREQARCEAQEQQDEYQYTSCEYKGAYVSIVKKFPKWSASHHLSPPGREDKDDRKKAFFKTHPAEYRQYSTEIAAGVNYRSSREWVWERVNENECNDTWNCNTGNGYYGGLQMDRGFQMTYNPIAYRIWGTANNWPREAQEKAADRAYDGYNGYGPRGLGPWPSSNAEMGTFPTPVR